LLLIITIYTHARLGTIHPCKLLLLAYKHNLISCKYGSDFPVGIWIHRSQVNLQSPVVEKIECYV